ncbi:M14 family metallopeptidase [Psychroserpens sp. MEBiC05023]
MQLGVLKSLYKTHKETALFGRYIYRESIVRLLGNLSEKFTVSIIGESVNKIPIQSITLGHGKKKILMWSQMHGNESTTTKAVFDLLNTFSLECLETSHILENCTIQIIPMLNPDGAKAYTRVNANGIDLNRDAQDLSQPESRALRSVFNEFKPDFCYNLHGQRTIFSAGNSSNSAVVSFLAPAQDAERTITVTRKIAMEVISKMNDNLQLQIPDHVGIYDDGFNLNCVGDTFQSQNVPTILFEAGHFPNDYEREQTRKFIYQSLLLSLSYISKNNIDGANYSSYLGMPKNEKLFYDVIIRNAKQGDIAIQYQEKLVGDRLKFVPKIEKISNSLNFHGHIEHNANGYEVFAENIKPISEGNEIDFVMINNEKFSINL